MTNFERAVGQAGRLFVLGFALTVAACSGMGTGSSGALGSSTNSAEEQASGNRALLSSGMEAENAHNYDLAINAFGTLYERQPGDAKVLTALLRNMRYAGRAADAVAYVGQRAGQMLEDPQVHFEYAKAQLDAGQKMDALNSLRKVSAEMPDNWQVHNAMGIAFDSVGQFDNSIAAYRTALAYAPNSSVVMNNLAISQAMAGKLAEAIKTLEAAAAINRTNTHVRQNLALLYAANGETEKARALAAMDLSSGDLETNMSFYRRFGGGAQ